MEIQALVNLTEVIHKLKIIHFQEGGIFKIIVTQELTTGEMGIKETAVEVVELIVIVTHGFPCTCIHCHPIENVSADISTQ